MQKTIVVADDDQAIVEVMKIVLEQYGYSVVSITNGACIIQEVEKTMPALIFLDVWLSGYDGSEITKKIKNNEKTKHIPIVIISANNNTQRIAQEAGADAFMTKPFDINDITAVVKQYIRR